MTLVETSQRRQLRNIIFYIIRKSLKSFDPSEQLKANDIKRENKTIK